MMKILSLSLITFLLFSFNEIARYPVVKLYAYQQKVSKGANFSTSDKKISPLLKHYVFVEVRKNENITLSGVWLNGKKADFDTVLMSSPVTIEKSLRLSKTPAYDTLVPATKNYIIQVLLNTTKQLSLQKAPARYKHYPLLIEYRVGHKRYYLGSKTFKELNPEVNQ